MTLNDLANLTLSNVLRQCMQLVCLIFGHRRSRSRARRREDGSLESVCRRCGVPMIRSDEGDWSMKEGETAEGQDKHRDR